MRTLSRENSLSMSVIKLMFWSDVLFVLHSMARFCLFVLE